MKYISRQGQWVNMYANNNKKLYYQIKNLNFIYNITY